MSAAIEAECLGKRYGLTWAVRNFTAAIPAGSICALVGVNGAGKTTLLRLLAGVARPSEGTVQIGGRQPGDDTNFLRKVGYVAQTMPLYLGWTVRDHLRFGAHLNGVWDATATEERLVAAAIPLERKVAALSGGMRAHVALALALGKHPEVLLLDEPLAALDPRARRQFMSTLVGAVAQEAMTVLLSSHLLADLERVCDHLIVMAGGQPVLVGDVDALVDQHCLVRAPAACVDPLDRDHAVIAGDRSAREIGLVIRRNGPILDPRCETSALSLEEIILAYLEPASGPRRTGAEALALRGRR